MRAGADALGIGRNRRIVEQSQDRIAVINDRVEIMGIELEVPRDRREKAKPGVVERVPQIGQRLLEIDMLGVLGDLGLERRVAALATPRFVVVTLLLFDREREELLGELPRALDQRQRDAVIGAHRETEPLERSTDRGGKCIGVARLVGEAERGDLGGRRIEHGCYSEISWTKDCRINPKTAREQRSFNSSTRRHPYRLSRATCWDLHRRASS